MKPHILVALAGALITIIGTFTPWVTFFGISTNAWSNGMGVPAFFLFCIGICVGMAFIPRKWVNAFSVLFALIISALGIVYMSDAGPLAGIGIYLFFAGGLILLVGAIMGFFQKTN